MESAQLGQPISGVIEEKITGKCYILQTSEKSLMLANTLQATLGDASTTVRFAPRVYFWSHLSQGWHPAELLKGRKDLCKAGPPPQYFQSFYCKKNNYMKVQPKGCWVVSQPCWKPVAQGRPLALASLWHRSSVQVPVPEIKRRTHPSLCWLDTCWKRFPIWLGAGLLSSHWPKWKNTPKFVTKIWVCPRDICGFLSASGISLKWPK